LGAGKRMPCASASHHSEETCTQCRNVLAMPP
jgi:hypothetical protein